jgi:heme-degrading monooxygenase HmoA
MMARIWYGRTRPEHFDEYAKYVEETGLRGLGATDGNLGSFLFRRLVDDQAEFLVLSFWESFDAIRVFAGEDVEVARYYPEDTRFLLELEPTVQHYEVSGTGDLGGLGEWIAAAGCFGLKTRGQ